MKTIAITLIAILNLLGSYTVSAQSTTVTESITLENETALELVFTFADQITFKTWDRNEVKVDVSVEIQGGKYNDIFTLSSERKRETIIISMDKNMWRNIDKKDRENGTNSQLDYVVYLPKNLEVTANTISGNYELEYFGSPLKLKTISGEIDLIVPSNANLDFSSKTITGEVFTDIEIDYPEGRDGLRQVVGQHVIGRIKKGGIKSAFETISGNIYLRKG